MRRQNLPQPSMPVQRNMNYQQYGQQQDEYDYDEDEQHDMDQYGEYDENEEGEYVFENEEQYLEYQAMKEQELAQQGIHLIEQDPYFEPTEEEILAYAEFLGMNLEEDQEFFQIAREGLVAPLPEGWCYAQVDGEDATYFYCRETEGIYEENPNDEYFRNKYIDEKRLKDIKKQRENPPTATSKKRSKLQNLIDQYSNTGEEESNKTQSKQSTKQNIKSQQPTNVNISNIDASAANSNKNSVVGQTTSKNDPASLSHIAAQQTTKNLQPKQNSMQETNMSKGNTLQSITNAKTIKNKLNPLEPLNEKFSKEISDSKPSSNIALGKKELEYEFDEDEHAFLQSDDEDEEDKKSRQSSNLPKGKGSILETKSQNSRPPSASNKNKESRATSILTGKEKESTQKETTSKDQKKKVDELQEVDLEDFQKQDANKNLTPSKLNPIIEKKPSALKPLEKKSSKDIPSQQKESSSQKNTLKDIPSILEVSDQKILESDQKLDGTGFTLGIKQLQGQKSKEDIKKEDTQKNDGNKETKLKEKNDLNIEKTRQSQDLDSQIKDDFDKNFASSGQKQSSVESYKKTDNSKSNDYNLTKDFEDAENQTYTYSKEESISQDQISTSKKNEEFSPNTQQEVSPIIPKKQDQGNKKLIKIEEHLSDNESDVFPSKQQQADRRYNVETQNYQEKQQEELQEEDEAIEMDIQSLEFEDQINVQAYIEEKEKELNNKINFFEKEQRQHQIYYNQLLQGEKFSNYDSVDNERKRKEYLQEQEKIRIRQTALKEIQSKEDAEIKRIQLNLEEAVKIQREEENFAMEQKVIEFSNLLKDKFYRKLEQHEKIIKNLKGIISKNEIIHSQHRRILKDKFDSQYKTSLFQQASAKYQSDLVLLEKEFEDQQQNVIYGFEDEFERTKQLEADELQKQKMNQTVKQLDLKELYIKRYYMEKSESESEVQKQLESMFKDEKENIDLAFHEKYQQELNQMIFKKQRIHESELEFINQMNEQKLNDFSKLTMKESDHKIKLLEIEHSRRLNQLEEQLREQKGLRNNYKYISERQAQTESDIKLQITEIKNLIYLKNQSFGILKNEQRKIQQDYQDLHFSSNILSNEQNLEEFLKQQLENRINSINHLKERQKEKEKDFKLLRNQQQQLQQQIPSQNNGTFMQDLSEIQNILINFPHTTEKLYKNKKRSKLWTECIKQENLAIDQQKQKLKYQKIYLKTVYVDMQKEKEKQKEEIEKIKKQNDINESEKQYLIQNVQSKSKNLVQQFNEDVKLVRRNEEQMRKRDEQLLQFEKQFNKTMNLGLDEENLIEEYIKLKKLTSQQLKELKLVPNNDFDVKTKINNYQDVSSYLDVTGDDQANDGQQNAELYQRFQFGDTEVNKEPHKLRQMYEGLKSPFIKGVIQQREDQNQQNVERIENLLKNAKYSQQIMSAKLNGFLQRREYAKLTENADRIKSEVSQHQKWFKDVKQYINQTLYDRTTIRSHLNTII